MFPIYRIYKHISTVSNCVFLTPIIADYYLMFICDYSAGHLFILTASAVSAFLGKE